MKIAVLGDLHFGLKTHSDQLSTGFTSCERDAITALEQFYIAASEPDIDMVIFTGDITHTNHPTSLVVSYLTSYFVKLDMLNKPIYAIPGNHDKSNYSHSFEFLKSDHLKNVVVVDDSTVKFSTNDEDIYFVPFKFGDNPVDKYSSVQEEVSNIISTATKRSIIVSHFQESSSVSGSESVMISKSVELFDADQSTPSSPVMLLLGHIHHHQVYTKRNGITVCYTGNPYCMDKTDANKIKGFVVVNSNNFSATQIPVTGIRKFVQIHIDTDKDALSYVKSLRIVPNSVFFIDNIIKSAADRVNMSDINDYLKTYNSKVVQLTNSVEELKNLIMTSTESQLNYVDMFKSLCESTYKSELSETEFSLLVSVGSEKLSEVSK